MSRCRWVCACCSRESRLPLPCSTGLPVPPEKRWSTALNYEPSHLSMAAVGSLRREEGDKSPGTHELFTVVLSKQSAIIYLFSPAGLRLRAQGAGKAARAACVQPHALSSALGRHGAPRGQASPRRPQKAAHVPQEHLRAVLAPVCVSGRKKTTNASLC